MAKTIILPSNAKLFDGEMKEGVVAATIWQRRTVVGVIIREDSLSKLHKAKLGANYWDLKGAFFCSQAFSMDEDTTYSVPESHLLPLFELPQRELQQFSISDLLEMYRFLIIDRLIQEIANLKGWNNNPSF